MKKLIPQTPWTGKGLWSLEPLSLFMLVVGLVLFGVGESCLVLANLGSASWTILSQGISESTGIELGWMTFIISSLVMLLWIPLKIKPGLGTILNIIIIAFVIGQLTDHIAKPTSFLMRVLLLIVGVVIIGIASAIYLTSHKGAGPRDGLLVGLCQLLGWRVAIVRTLLEGSVSLLGWLLGGPLGIGTLCFAFGVGWVMQFSLGCLSSLFRSLNDK
ncbi:hypothetical protein HMPREF9318_02111 [Streptococcus urinalis FB127-CNA-2]|uniref:YitT family protein n=1 Tax=Streptococcus urinalis 2285-97 TaxID=764291 RepID=G5KIF4_9STRE|nr:membrane protein [Streptococcus urinalis]EHJ56422.1 hypothetical protein STRUR_1665 [Streptococcus urinalis 2285-97]EKS17234.1 hypothetical protein HMPREF9318_02111 [Streptococcus urinalis FB127-CNA-2]VEF32516.1 membrane protein [Streptococcus urinalis]